MADNCSDDVISQNALDEIYNNTSPPFHDVGPDDPFYFVQDVDGFLEKVDKKRQAATANLAPAKNKAKKTATKDQTKKLSSYVIKNDIRKGRYLIKINIEALNDGDPNRNVSAQYLVCDPCDEVLDSTEYVLTRILRRLDEK